MRILWTFYTIEDFLLAKTVAPSPARRIGDELGGMEETYGGLAEVLVALVVRHFVWYWRC